MKKNKIIGIITYQNAINYGAILQAYAINNYINKKGVKCETLNYKSKKIESSYKLLKIDFKNPKLLINSIIGIKDNYIKKKKFEKFKKQNIVLSTRSYNSNNIQEANKYYSDYITGSDQVWNLDLNEDKNYYLCFADINNNSKNSYAASFGNVNVVDNNKEWIGKELKTFSNISVREESGKNKLEDLLDINSTLVLDPTFLLSDKEWNRMCSNDILPNKYILLYILHEETAYSIANRISKLMGLDVYVINQSYKKRIEGKYIRNAGPEEFLSLIRNCEFMITDSFHGTAFSIIFKKNLKVVLKEKNKYLNDRLISLLTMFNLKECITDTSMPDEKLIARTDYSKSNKEIESEIKKSEAFLNLIINK